MTSLLLDPSFYLHFWIFYFFIFKSCFSEKTNKKLDIVSFGVFCKKDIAEILGMFVEFVIVIYFAFDMKHIRVYIVLI